MALFDRLRERRQTRFRAGLEYILDNEQQLVNDGFMVPLSDVQRETLVKAYYSDHALDEMAIRARGDRRFFRLLRDAEAQEGPRDWAGFFSAFAEFINAILPALMQIFGMFGIVAPMQMVAENTQATTRQSDSEWLENQIAALRSDLKKMNEDWASTCARLHALENPPRRSRRRSRTKSGK